MKRKRLLALLLAAVMVMGCLAACSKSNNGNGNNGGGSGNNSGSTATDTPKTDDGATTDDDKPDTWIADRTIQVQAYVDDIGYALAADQLNTDVMNELQRRTGMKIEFLYTPGEKDRYVMAAQLAAGNLPDMICSYLNNSTRPEFPILLSAAKDGMFTDLTPYLKDSKVYSKYLDEDYLPSDTYSNIMFREDLEGACYFVHLSIDAVDNSLVWNPADEYRGGLYIQREIAEDLNLDVKSINTSEQLYQLLKQIQEKQYKDSNGNSVVPLGPKYWGGSFDSLQYVLHDLMWGVSGFYNLAEDGHIYHEAQTDWVYKQIEYVRRLLEEGLMHQEFFTMDETRANELYANKSAAIMSDVHNYVDIIYGSDTWIPLGPIADYTGSTAKITSGKGGYGQWAIPATTENPEEIVKLMDYLSSEEGQLLCLYGVEGVTYDMVDGKPVLKDEVKTAIEEGNTEQLLKWGAAFDGSGVYGLTYLLTDLDNEVRFGESRPGAGGGDTNNVYQRAVEIATDYAFEYKLVPGLNASAFMTELEDVNTAMSLLDYTEVMTQAFYADSWTEVEKIVESFRSQLKSAGIDEFIALLEEKYAENPETINFY